MEDEFEGIRPNEITGIYAYLKSVSWKVFRVTFYPSFCVQITLPAGLERALVVLVTSRILDSLLAHYLHQALPGSAIWFLLLNS